MTQADLRLTPPYAYGFSTYPPGASYGPRRMREYEFVWIIDGDVEYRWGELVTATPAPSLVLCRPEAVDFFRFDPDLRTQYAYFHFDVLSYPNDWPPMDEWPLARPLGDGDILPPLIRHLLAWADRGNARQVELTMLHILTAYVTGQTASGELPRQLLPEAVERAYTYIHERLDSDPAARLDLGELARVAGVNREYLCRLFKASTGRSPVETARLARLDRAALLLSRSNYSVSEIAALYGYSSPFHFSQRFKTEFGQSPRDLRAGLEAGATPPASRLVRTSAPIR